MIRFSFEPEKALASLLFVADHLRQAKKSPGLHKVFKIFYFADQKHIARFGRPIFGDDYVAMKYGPVPSNTYDMVKSVRGDGCFNIKQDLNEYFKVEGSMLWPLVSPDLDEIADSEVACLLEAINENQDLEFEDLTKKSHDEAYDNAAYDNHISFRDIAKVAGATQGMIAYMEKLAENRGDIENVSKARRIFPS